MAIRITGMYSGLDTESIIEQLASAQSYKKTKLVKEQKRLSWKQDAWKSLNTKLYSFYQKLDDLRLQSSYMKKKTISSNPNAVSVVSNGNAVEGVQSISVTDLARSGYLTGGELKIDGGKVTGSTTLEQLGFTDSGSISVNTGNGSSVKIDVSKDMTVDQFVDKLNKAGLNASFDANYGRMYVSSKETGALANFTLTGDNEAGMKALASLGLLSKEDIEKDMETGGVYDTWAKYKDGLGTRTQDYIDLIDAEIAKRAAAYKAENDKLNAENESLKKKNDEALEAYKKDYPDATIADVDKLRKSLYGYDEEQEVGGEKKTVHVEGLEEKVNSTKKDLEDAKAELERLKKENADTTAAAEEVTAKSQAASEAQNEFNTAKGKYSYLNAIDENNKKIAENDAKINANAKKFAVDTDGKVTDAGTLRDDVEKELDAKVAASKEIVADKDKYLAQAKEGQGTKIDGTDAKITLNGVDYTSKSSSFQINGMTITALEITDKDKPITLSTTTDTDGIYDMIKGLFTEYNKLINEMDSLYNADAAKGYDPLTSEEKKELTDDEVEEWEKKVKDSLLRRDSSLNSVASAMKEVMLQGVEMGGKTMYLADFGINTLGYFKAADNEKNAYHIDGDSEDTSVSGNKDILKSMIASDPETVMNFFTKLSNNMHDKLQEKMAAVKDTSSALTFYNDKLLKKEYDEYTTKIKKQEDKVNALMDKWYAKFSAMETAMAKLQSKNNAISGMLGGN